MQTLDIGAVAQGGPLDPAAKPAVKGPAGIKAIIIILIKITCFNLKCQKYCTVNWSFFVMTYLKQL